MLQNAVQKCLPAKPSFLSHAAKHVHAMHFLAAAEGGHAYACMSKCLLKGKAQSPAAATAACCLQKFMYGWRRQGEGRDAAWGVGK